MKGTLYTRDDGLVGTVTLPSAQVFPPTILLDERPRGGLRRFRHTFNGRYEGRYEEQPLEDAPVVKLDPPDYNTELGG